MNFYLQLIDVVKKMFGNFYSQLIDVVKKMFGLRILCLNFYCQLIDVEKKCSGEEFYFFFSQLMLGNFILLEMESKKKFDN